MQSYRTQKNGNELTRMRLGLELNEAYKGLK